MSKGDGQAVFDVQTGWNQCGFSSDDDVIPATGFRHVAVLLTVADPFRPLADLTAPMKGCKKPDCRPAKALGPYAKIIDEVFFERGGIATGCLFVVFPCGRRSCMIEFSVSDTVGGTEKDMIADAVGLAAKLQDRARHRSALSPYR